MDEMPPLISWSGYAAMRELMANVRAHVRCKDDAQAAVSILQKELIPWLQEVPESVQLTLDAEKPSNLHEAAPLAPDTGHLDTNPSWMAASSVTDLLTELSLQPLYGPVRQ